MIQIYKYINLLWQILWTSEGEMQSKEYIKGY